MSLPAAAITPTDVYAWLGGPDDLHSAAWKNLKSGEELPVGSGCCRLRSPEASPKRSSALTEYRRAACQLPHAENTRCPVIFNDYMNCLWADPTEENELPMIEAAAKAGCEYYVIDAGWYAALREDWSPTIGAWQPSTDRFPQGCHSSSTGSGSWE